MTTNNLIGYDPLAWMDGAELEEETSEPIPEPAKKVTKSKAKAKTAPVEEVAVIEEPVAVANDVEIVTETAPENDIEESSDTIEVEVSIDEDGEVEITIEAAKLSVEVSIENNEDDVIEASAEKITENVTAQEEIKEEFAQEEEIAVAEEHIEEAPVEALAEPHIDLESESTIKNVTQLYKTVKNSLAAHDAIEINAADITTIDTATLQLLVSLKKDAPNLGKTIDIIYPSARFLESAKLLGLIEILDV
jgi:ABC-type transporter Mla MlaB component